MPTHNFYGNFHCGQDVHKNQKVAETADDTSNSPTLKLSTPTDPPRWKPDLEMKHTDSPHVVKLGDEEQTTWKNQITLEKGHHGTDLKRREAQSRRDEETEGEEQQQSCGDHTSDAVAANEVQISNSFDASQIFFNPPIMETESFLKRDVASNALTLVESEQDKLEREIRRDKWMQLPQRDIGELLQSTQDWGWYYFGCKTCQKKVYKISTNLLILNMFNRFRIHVLVKDGTGEAYLMLLDWIATTIVPDSATDLLDGSFDELQDIESFSEAITALVGKTFMFGVFIEKDNITSKGGIYKVGKVWKDISMLLTGGSTTESCTQSDVGTTNLSGSHGSLLLMESQANEDIAVTPSSKRKEQSNEGELDISSTTKKQCTRVFVKKEKTIKEESSSKKSG
ncbi:hypothetical protein N665_1258s0008 [Sinapis alba]|nr:hypothetical protein N665_1258s0008 [Sinapis alba]